MFVPGCAPLLVCFRSHRLCKRSPNFCTKICEHLDTTDFHRRLKHLPRTGCICVCSFALARGRPGRTKNPVPADVVPLGPTSGPGLGCLGTCGLFRKSAETAMEVLRSSAPLVTAAPRAVWGLRVRPFWDGGPVQYTGGAKRKPQIVGGVPQKGQTGTKKCIFGFWCLLMFSILKGDVQKNSWQQSIMPVASGVPPLRELIVAFDIF